MMKKIFILLFSFAFSEGVFSQCYTIDYLSYNAVAFNGTTINLSDDQYSYIIQIGFPFCFYGAAYTSLLVGSNGVISFDTTKAGTYCVWPIISLALPDQTSQVK